MIRRTSTPPKFSVGERVWLKDRPYGTPTFNFSPMWGKIEVINEHFGYFVVPEADQVFSPPKEASWWYEESCLEDPFIATCRGVIDEI